MQHAKGAASMRGIVSRLALLTTRGGGGGTVIYGLCAAVKGMVFKQFSLG